MMRTATDVGITKLYHYERFDPNYLHDMLTYNRVHFSSPARFNDPWDCSPMYVMDRVVATECMDAWSNFLLKNAAHVLTHEQVMKLEQLSLMKHIDFLEDTLKKTTAHSKEITMARWRIYCLTPGPASILMWAHYADRHAGLCLEFDATLPQIGRARQVAYDEQRPLIRWQTLSDNSALTEMMLLTKSEDWNYEHEFRILCRNCEIDKEPADTLCKTSGDYLELPPDAISRVIVGARGDYVKVKELVNACRPDLKVHHANIAEKEYKVIIPPDYWP